MKPHAHRNTAGTRDQSHDPAQAAVRESRRNGGGARPALAMELGAIYRNHASDLIKCARRWGSSPEDAEDSTHEFFLRLEMKDSLRTFDRKKGQFRSFLLTLFQRFLANQWHSLHALRRGGTAAALPLGSALEVDKALIDWRTPEKEAQLHWTRLVLERAFEALRRDLERQGKARLFDALLPHLLNKHAGASYASSAGRLGLSDAAARMTVSRFRERLRTLICRELDGNGSGNGHGRDEIRDLLHMFKE